MKDEITESTKNYCHLQRVPSLSRRDKEMALLPGLPWRTVGTVNAPNPSIFTRISFAMGELKTFTGPPFLRTHLKDNPNHLHHNCV